MERVATSERPTRVPVASPTSTRPNIALLGSASASQDTLSAQKAIDGNLESMWNSSGFPIQWIMITLDDYYLVDSVEMIVAQTPAGETSHEIWLGDASGTLFKYKEFVNVRTEDGQILALALSQDHRSSIDPHSCQSELCRMARSGGVWQVAATNDIGNCYSCNIHRPIRRVAGNQACRGLKFPIQITNARDGSGRIFVVEQQGSIRPNGALLNAPFLAISDRVKCCWEQGPQHGELSQQ